MKLNQMLLSVVLGCILLGPAIGCSRKAPDEVPKAPIELPKKKPTNAINAV